MLIFPVTLQMRTNREDLRIDCQVWDDDLNQPLSLAPIVLGPGNQNGFTSNSWTVIDGSIVTASASTLTIPGYPIGNQLEAVSLIVGTGLGILAGDAITIVDTGTGLNSMTGYVTSYAPTTGALIVQASWTFEFEIRRQTHDRRGDGYSTFFDVGVVSDIGPLLTASLGPANQPTFIQIIDISSVEIMVREASFKRLHGPKTYSACLTGTNSVDTMQFFKSDLPVEYGGVTS